MSIAPGIRSGACSLVACAAVLAQDLPVNWRGLPAPYAIPSARNPPWIVPRPAGAELSLPAGFAIEEWARSLDGGPREMLPGPAGEVIVTQMGDGSVTVIRDGKRKDVLRGLNGPFGLAMGGNELYVADIDAVRRYRYDSAGMSASGAYYFTRVREGGFYGWPYAYIGPHEDPRRRGEAPALVASTLYPDVLPGGHAGAMDVPFYTGSRFPERYRNGAFIALHGSWNRAKRAGYKVVFVPFEDGRPVAGGGLRERLDARRGSPGGLGPTSRSAAEAGRFIARLRRWRRHDMASDLQRRPLSRIA